MYRTIDVSFWTDPKVRKLTPEARAIFFYLITSPHSHVSGIFVLSKVIISVETGYPIDTLSIGVLDLDRAGLCKFDEVTEVCWVCNMMKYQAHGEKADRAAANQLSNLHNSFLIKLFLKKYPAVKRYRIDTLSIGVPAQDQVGIQEQEQEQEQEKKEYFCSEPENTGVRAADDGDKILEFPTVGKEKTWSLKESKQKQYQELYPNLDVPQEIRKARQWCIDNPGRRKTNRGMTAFLGRWLDKAVNSYRSRPKEPDELNFDNENTEKLDQLMKQRQVDNEF